MNAAELLAEIRAGLLRRGVPGWSAAELEAFFTRHDAALREVVAEGLRNVPPGEAQANARRVLEEHGFYAETWPNGTVAGHDSLTEDDGFYSASGYDAPSDAQVDRRTANVVRALNRLPNVSAYAYGTEKGGVAVEAKIASVYPIPAHFRAFGYLVLVQEDEPVRIYVVQNMTEARQAQHMLRPALHLAGVPGRITSVKLSGHLDASIHETMAELRRESIRFKGDKPEVTFGLPPEPSGDILPAAPSTATPSVRVRYEALVRPDGRSVEILSGNYTGVVKPLAGGPLPPGLELAVYYDGPTVTPARPVPS